MGVGSNHLRPHTEIRRHRLLGTRMRVAAVAENREAGLLALVESSLSALSYPEETERGATIGAHVEQLKVR
jgi:hypothetical protein